MKTNEIREKYLEFFQTKDHRLVESDVLVPTWDPTVIFTPAGMNQFKDHFLGKVDLEYTRATTCQKCLRTGDIENVGRTAYHHTFFEMLGNFSFGDYFKRDAIRWAWEFLTDRKWLAIDPQRLTVSVYTDDDEAFDIWHTDVGLDAARIRRMDEYENFWPAGAPTDGPDGVCGPCSEIFYHPDVGAEVEIWNLVFTQFNRVGDPPDNLQPLPSKNIDTGMGLERTAATLQGVETNFHIDILKSIVQAVSDVCQIQYEFASDDGRRMRRITDHIRACTFAIHENVDPGPNKASYVVRQLLRRAVLDGHQMGMREAFLFKLVPAVVEAMQVPYPELEETADRVANVIHAEENSFLATLDDGLDRMEKYFASMTKSDAKVVDGNSTADLYTTYGVPPELFEQIASERGYQLDWEGFRQAMEAHGRKSGKIAEGVMGDFGPIDEIKRQVKKTEFTGYRETESSAVVRGLVSGDATCQSLSAGQDAGDGGQMVILDRSPFYGEAGGQVGDTGVIQGPNGKFEVHDTQRNGDLIVHIGQVAVGTISIGDDVSAIVDAARRDAIRRAHSATHILHHALQQQLGSHAQQRGSKVTDDWLRFDFSNREPVAEEQLLKIEHLSNQRIEQATPIVAEILPLRQAKEQGAMMLFGERYPDPVRMVTMGEFSKELCGGTHLDNTSQVGRLELISEEAVSAGTRRIVAVTGDKATDFASQTRDALDRLCKLLNCAAADVPQAIMHRMKRAKYLKKQLSSGQAADADVPFQASATASKNLSHQQCRDLLKQAARQLNVPMLETPSRVESILAEIDQLDRQLDALAESVTIDASSLIERCTMVGDIHLVVAEVPGANPNMMRGWIDQIRKKIQPSAIFLASIQSADKVLLVAGLSQDLVKRGFSAGNWVKDVAPAVGGGGGGKPDMAQAGGKQPENINVALDAAREYLRAASVT